MSSELTPVRVTPIVESLFGLDGGAMFGIIPKPIWQRTNPADEKNRIQLAARLLVLESGDRRVLVDAGMGDKWTHKERGIYAVEYPTGTLERALSGAGFPVETITDVVITHLHLDHAGGLTKLDENGEIVPVFGAATHWVQRENFTWAHHPTARDTGSYRRENFDFFGGAHAPKLELVDGTSKIVDDMIEVIPTRGHTPGLQMLRFRTDKESFIYPSDILPTLGHLQLPYVMGFDCHPLTTVREKREVLEEAIRNDWIVVLEHDPIDGFARIERAGVDRYRVAKRAGTLADLD